MSEPDADGTPRCPICGRPAVVAVRRYTFTRYYCDGLGGTVRVQQEGAIQMAWRIKPGPHTWEEPRAAAPEPQRINVPIVDRMVRPPLEIHGDD